MGAPFHKILSKLERAVVAYIIAQGAGTATYTYPDGTVSPDTLPGKNSNVKRLPITIAWGKHWKVDPPHGMEFLCDLTLTIRTSAPPDAGETPAELLAASNARTGAVFGCFTEADPNNCEGLPNAITAAARAKAAADAVLDPVGPDVDLADFTFLSIVDQSGDADADESGDVWIDSMDLKVRCSPYNVS